MFKAPDIKQPTGPAQPVPFVNPPAKVKKKPAAPTFMGEEATPAPTETGGKTLLGQ